MNALENALAGLFSSFPPLPENSRQMLKTIYPWLLIITSVFGALAALPRLGCAAVSTMFDPVYGTSFMLYAILLGLRAVLGLYGGLRMLNGSRQGWVFAMYACLVGIAAFIVHFSIVSIIFSLLLLYLLFQIRSYFSDNDSQSSMS